jgi:uncharacterized repeat protein (TIGR01451 family)
MCLRQVAGRGAFLVWTWLAAATLAAQQPGVHYWHHGVMPPGAIGHLQLMRGGPLSGHFQPVEIRVPQGARISLARENCFDEPAPGTRKTGLLIGRVYRLRVTGIPRAEGLEVFPTLEVINRLYVPPGREQRFAVPVELTEEDLKLALQGKFVTRVIYLEDPQRALPVQEDPQSQNYFETAPGQDLLAVADALGRPMAILRMGGRLPGDHQGPDDSFFYGSPPFVEYPVSRSITPPPHSSSASGIHNVGHQELPPSASTEAPPVEVMVSDGPEGSPGGELSAGNSPGFPGQESGSCPLPDQASGPWAPPGIRQPWPEDEYLRDGGDQGTPAGAGRNWEVRGLEVDDTVAHFDTLDGRTVVVPSNEVYLYSPRFGAVRQVVSVEINEQMQAVRTVHRSDGLLTPQRTQRAGAAKQNLQAENQIAALPAQAFRRKQYDGAVSTALGPQGFSDAFKAYEDLALVRKGKMEMADLALLARSAEAAAMWTHTRAVQVILDGRGPMELVEDQKTLALMTTLPPGNPRLRIVKLASTSAALPGEEVWFTLRFDNVGGQVIGNVTVIDSLDTRLEYVAGSAQCSRAAQFSTEPNEGGSQVLRCEISDPLKPGEGGIVRFRCLVR